MKNESLRLRALEAAISESPNSHSTRELPRSTEYAPSPPIHCESPRKSALASGHGSACTAGGAAEQPSKSAPSSQGNLTTPHGRPSARGAAGRMGGDTMDQLNDLKELNSSGAQGLSCSRSGEQLERSAIRAPLARGEALARRR